MKTKKINSILILAILMFITTGCSGQSGSQAGFQDETKISIVTTIYPLYDFASNVAGDKAEIINLVPAGVEPHDFELSTGDMQLIEQADVFIYNGAGMEHFVDKTLQSISNEDLVVVECANGLELLQGEHAHNHDDEEDVHEEDEHTGQTDPHTWLSIRNAILEAEVIKETLVLIDADNAEYYKTNFENYKAQLTELQELYETELSAVSKDTIVVAHEAFGYLCEEYGLHQEGIEGLTADSEPDSARMKEIIDYCKEEDVQVIFFEELVSPKVAQTVAAEVGAETMVLNPIEGLTVEQEEEGLDYIGLMKENLEALKKALK